MIVNVELIRFGNGKMRPVEVPNETPVDLENVYINGQNGYNNRHLELPSVSVGDIIHLGEERWVVKGFGFELLSGERYSLFKRCLSESVERGVRYCDVLWENMGPESIEYC